MSLEAYACVRSPELLDTENVELQIVEHGTSAGQIYLKDSGFDSFMHR
jgi:hypothetical protein